MQVDLTKLAFCIHQGYPEKTADRTPYRGKLLSLKGVAVIPSRDGQAGGDFGMISEGGNVIMETLSVPLPLNLDRVDPELALFCFAGLSRVETSLGGKRKRPL